MLKDLIINKRNIVFIFISSILVVILNFLFLNRININCNNINIYSSLNFDFVAESNSAYQNDDCYYYLDDYFYLKNGDNYKLIDSNLLMQIEEKNNEVFYNNLVIDTNNENENNSVIISNSIATKYDLNVNDSLYDINDNIYYISSIVEDIEHLFGRENKINSLIIINYDESKLNNETKYLNFCHYNENLYTKIYFSTNNLIIEETTTNNKLFIIYSITIQMITIIYLLFCFYQFKLEKAFYINGYSKKRLLIKRIFSIIIDFTIIFLFWLIPNIILKINNLLFYLPFLASILSVLSLHIIYINKFHNRKRCLINV